MKTTAGFAFASSFCETMSPEAKTGHCNGPASSSLGKAIALAGEAIAPAGVEEDDEVPKEAAVMAQMKPGGRPSCRR